MRCARGGWVGGRSFAPPPTPHPSPARPYSNNDNRLIPGPDADLTTVPFHFYRTSTDIRPTYGSVAANWQTAVHLST